jgi:hypothetical protein
MRLERGKLTLEKGGGIPSGEVYLARLDLGFSIGLTHDELRWLCLVAGPALLNELAKGVRDGND